jgi:sensor histidine kinase YesM
MNRLIRIFQFLLLLFSLLPAVLAASSDTLYLDTSIQERRKVGIASFVGYYRDKTGHESFDEIYRKSQFATIGSLNGQETTNTPVWARLIAHNTGPDTLNLIFFLGYHIIDDMYIAGVDTTQPPHGKPMEFVGLNDSFSVPLKLPPSRTVTCWVRSSTFLLFHEFNPYIFSKAGYRSFKRSHTDSTQYSFGYRAMVMGLCFFLGLFAIVQSVYNKDRTYGYWGLYLWATFTYFLFGLDHQFKFSLVSDLNKPWMIVAQFPIQITYLLFLNAYLKIARFDLTTFRLIVGAVVIMAVGMIFCFYSIYEYNGDYINLSESFTLFNDLLILIIFIQIVRKKVPQTRLLLIGSMGVLISAVIAAIIGQARLMQFNLFWMDPVNIFSLGVTFELIFFSLALSERTQQIKRENQQLQENYTKKLEAELAERVEVIQKQNALLEEQRVQKITSDFEQRIARTEVAALRSQMNPHFIFNCLNSIKLYTLEHNADAASGYLTKFARLIRLVLDNSRSEKITLEDELETLKLYAEMEVMRFKDKVTFDLEIAPELDTLFIEIPPLILQPFVENAIWHGLMHKIEGGWVKVKVSQTDGPLLHIEITDNGIGRMKSKELKSKNSTLNKSFGIKVTSERIELINQMYRTETKCQVVDLYDEHGSPMGTQVVLEIPI